MGEENDKTQCACVCGSLVGRMLASERGVVWLVGRLEGGGEVEEVREGERVLGG